MRARIAASREADDLSGPLDELSTRACQRGFRLGSAATQLADRIVAQAGRLAATLATPNEKAH